MNLKEFCQEYGFENEREFHKLTCEADLSDALNLARFKNWQHTDGTKKGLLEVIKLNKEENNA